MLLAIELSIGMANVPLKLVNAANISSDIQSGAKYNNCIIEGNLDLSNLEINGNAYFNDTIFLDTANFESTKFKGDVNFENSRFKGDVDFRNSRFKGEADFKNSRFKGEASFNDSKLNGYAYFNNAKFKGDIFFVGSEFSKWADFGNTNFIGSADFVDSNFTGTANFTESQFSGDAYFDWAVFTKDSLFVDSTFKQNASFEFSRFKDVALFDRVKFNKVDLGSATYDRLFIRWDDLKDHLDYSDTAYLLLTKNFNNIGYFEDADKCYIQFRNEQLVHANFIDNIFNLEKSLMFILNFFALIFYGFGKAPIFPLFWSILSIIIFGLIWVKCLNFKGGIIERYRSNEKNLTKNRPCCLDLGILADALIFSAKVFLSGTRLFIDPPKQPEVPKGSLLKAAFNLERVLGAFFFSLLLIAIGATVIR